MNYLDTSNIFRSNVAVGTQIEERQPWDDDDRYDSGWEYESYSEWDNEPSLTGIPHCRRCNKVKGNKAKNRYFPDKPCNFCKSTDTVLRSDDGCREIDYTKWKKIQDEKHEAAMMALYARESGINPAEECGIVLANEY